MTARSVPLSAQELCASVRQFLPFDAARLDRVLHVDTSRALIEVQAGTRWEQLAERLGRRLAATCATIGESIACNAAGPDGRPTVVHVESFTMITPDGQLRRIDRISQPALFSLVVGGQGLFGVLYSVTLRLESLARAVAEAQPPESRIAPSGAAHARPLRLLVPPAELDALLKESAERCAQWRIAVESMELRPIRPEEETFLRWAGREYAEVSLRLGTGGTLGNEVRATQLRRELIDLAISHGGSFPIACTPEATRAQTQSCYPQLAGFLAEQRRLDPQQRWANPWLRHYRSLLGREGCEGRWGSQAEP